MATKPDVKRDPSPSPPPGTPGPAPRTAKKQHSVFACSECGATEPRWMGKQLAVMNEGYFLDTIKDVDEAWVEVSYEDSDVRVHGFVSKRDPPGRTHRHGSPELKPPAVTPNVTVADHTCLFVEGEPVGFITGAREVMLDKSARANEYTLTIDSPWGAISFDVHGPTETELDTCGS